MVLLMLFAVIAGAGTAVTPCVLPVLPALLSGSMTGGRRRPLGIVTGLSVTYTIAIVVLASVVDGVGLADDAARTVAIFVLLAFGLSLLVPLLGDRMEARLSRLSRFGPRSAGTGFWSGAGVGGALGFVYAPCAGPILAAVVSVSATQGSSTKIVAIALSYSLGSAAVLLLYALGGRRIAEAIRHAGRGPLLRRAVGAVMIATAVAMLADLDVRFQTRLAEHFPAFLVNPTRALERSDAVESRLADLRGRSRFDSDRASKGRGGQTAAVASEGDVLPVLGRAPDFTQTQRWFNTGGRRLRIAGLRGHVVLIDFWTYTCINCIRTLPYLRAWDERYRDKGLTIVGVHTPEFSFERNAGNVAAAIRDNRLRYPVVQDNEYGTWTAYGNQFWPAEYLIDARGRVRHTHFGEGEYGRTEQAIRALLEEARRQPLGARVHARAETVAAGVETPETYLGTRRAVGFVPTAPTAGTHRYAARGEPPPNRFALAGTWKVGPEAATAVRAASVSAHFVARRVFLVLSSAGGRARRVRVLLDGMPIGRGDGGGDVRGASVVVRGQRLYRIVSLPNVGRGLLTLKFDAGVSGYAFTFG